MKKIKLRKLKWGNSIFSRLVVTFLLIMIPIYMLGIFIYYWGVYTVKSEISKSTTAQVSFYLENLEKEIERIKILQYDCLNDEYLNNLAIKYEIMDYYDIKESMRQLQQRLVTIKNSSVYIKNVSAHILNVQKTISSNNGVDSIDMERYQEIRVPVGLKGAQIISYKNRFFLSTLQQKYVNPLCLIEVELNQDALKQALAQFNTYEESGSFLISMINKDIIMNQTNSDNILTFESFVTDLDKEENKGMEFVKINNRGYYIVHAKSEYLNMALLKYIPEEYILKPLKNFYIWVWVFTIVVVIILLVYSFSTYKFMHKPLLSLVDSFRKVEGGDLQVSINHNSNDEFGYLYKRFNDMVRNLNTLINQVYNQKILMQRAELKQLQSQINPHFLYNSLFMLNTMAKIGDENMVPFTKHLGEYFRFITRNSSDYISLNEEINHARIYIEIQLMRFPKRLQIQFGECPEEYRNMKVPRLILQPIIENAFEHGIEGKKCGGVISVIFAGDEKELNIIVEDNGSDMTDAGLKELKNALEYAGEELEITAIINIHQRIRLVFGEESGLQVYRSDLGGLKVVLKIILPRGEDHV